MNIGFIGCGNMAGAIIGGLLKKKLLGEENIFICDASVQAINKITESYPGIRNSPDNTAFLEKLDYLYLSVKPHVYEPAIREIRDRMNPATIVMTIAAGKTRAQVSELFGKDIKLVRAMPNTPALVGEGMCALCPAGDLTPEELSQVLSLWEAVGKVEILEERLFDAYTALCGSGPAYVFLFIEAMADAAVREGLSRDKAYVLAAQTVQGSARMVLETGVHPGVLKDQVCSPAGTTIEALGVLEEKGFRSSVMEAIRVCTQKSIQLSKNEIS